ncbi:MAG: NFACT family protein [Firmicutes bacterium]|nr:NFACT family protein [Bacillota bacterium]MCL2255756.1 NFACT family protein [Bacillota bacterium]
MPFDALNLKYLTNEMDTLLKNGRIDKIVMPTFDSVVFSIRANNKNQTLYISVNPSSPRIHLTSQKFTALEKPPSYLMHLRKYLTYARVLNVRQLEFERVIFFDLDAKDDLGNIEKMTLIVELMGKNSNLILSKLDGTVTDTLKKNSLDLNAKRVLFSGSIYAPPPPQDKLGIKCSKEVSSVLGAFEGGNLTNFVLTNFLGLAKSSVEDATFRAFGTIKIENLCHKTRERFATELIGMYDIRTFSPCVKTVENKAIDFFYRNYLHVSGDRKECETLSDAIEFYFSTGEKISTLSKEKNRVTLSIESATKKEKKRLDEIINKMLACENFEEDKIKGDLLLSNLHLIKKNDKSISVQNYYSESLDSIVIELDPTKTPQVVAQKFFKTYHKKKKTIDANKVFKERSQNNLEHFEYLLSCVNNATCEKELNEISSELDSVVGKRKNQNKDKIGKGKPNKNKKEVSVSAPILIEFMSHTIKIGKNNAQNDALFKSAKPNDIWLHVKGNFGSHVIIENKTTDFPPDEVIVRGAELAAFYSKEKASGKTNVDYTFIKNVKKLKDGGLGKVTLTTFYTLLAEPKGVE